MAKHLYLNPDTPIMLAAPFIEHLLCMRFGQKEAKRLYQALELQVSENTTSEIEQLISVITLLGKTDDQVNSFLCLLWFANHEAKDPEVRAALAQMQMTTLRQAIYSARKTVEHFEQHEED